MQSTELAGERWLRYWAWCEVSTAAMGVGDRAAAVAAAAEARAIEDGGWPPNRLVYGAVGESWVALIDGSAQYLQLTRRVLALDLAAGGSGHQKRAHLIDAELAAGDPQAAARTGEALLADLEGSRNEKALSYARSNLAAALLALDDTRRARCLAEAGWPSAPLFGWQILWADYLALLAALEGRPQAAARLIGYADAAYATREILRQSNEAAAIDRARTLARAALGEATFGHLQAEGATLRDEQIAVIAFAPGDGD